MLDKKLINKARRILKELLGMQRLYGQDYKWGAVEKIWTGHSLEYKVRVGEPGKHEEYYIYFEERGTSPYLRYNYLRYEPVDRKSAEDKAKAFLLDMLNGKGWQAVAKHRYGESADQIIREVRNLIKRLEVVE